MAHNDAREVERQYYEFRQRMAQKRAANPAPAAPARKKAPAKAPVKPAAKPVPPKAEEHIDAPMTTRLVKSAPIKPVGPAIEELAPVQEAVLHAAEPAAPKAQTRSVSAPAKTPVTEEPREEILPPAEEPAEEEIIGEIDEAGEICWYEIGTPEADAWAEAFYGGLYAHFKEKGQLDMLLMRLQDEPHFKDCWLWAREKCRMYMRHLFCAMPFMLQ